MYNNAISVIKTNFFVAIDFDGTVTDLDITDAILKKFAKPEWENIERLWEKGIIGSRECLARQMSLINAPLAHVLEYVSNFAINDSFYDFAGFLRKSQIPFCIISDGFQVVIERLLAEADLKNISVYSNQLIESERGLKTLFPYANENCSSGICKCAAARKISNGLPIILTGDGKSDFCLSEEAVYVFSKEKLTDYCRDRRIPHTAFTDFKTIAITLENLMSRKVTIEYTQREQRSWDLVS